MDTSGACCVWVCERVSVCVCTCVQNLPIIHTGNQVPTSPLRLKLQKVEASSQHLRSVSLEGVSWWWPAMMDTQIHTIMYHLHFGNYWGLLGWVEMTRKIGLWMQHDLTIIRSHPLVDWPQKSWAQKDHLEAVVALYQISVLGVLWSPWNHPWLIWKGPSIPAVKRTL